jgi:hypothetical protein
MRVARREQTGQERSQKPRKIWMYFLRQKETMTVL